MSEGVEQFKLEVIPKVVEAIQIPNEVLPAIEGRRSEVAESVIEVKGEKYTIRSQNTKKNSRFSKLALNNHQVNWVVRESDGEWFLFVDGRWTSKKKVTDDGSLLPDSEIG